MKNLLTILSVGLALLCGALAAVLLGQLHANRTLRGANDQLHADVRAAQARMAAVQAAQDQTAAQLLLAETASRQFQTRLAELEAASTSPPPGGVPTVKPYQAEAYLGQQWLGTGWVMPRNLRMDTNTQRYVYEPVIWLDERMRDAFVLVHTNIVEREVEVPTAYSVNNYYPTPWSGYYFGPSGGPGRPRPDWPPTLPPTVPPYPTPPAFNPGSGTVIPQKLGLPAERIKTIPQNVSPPSPPPATTGR